MSKSVRSSLENGIDNEIVGFGLLFYFVTTSQSKLKYNSIRISKNKNKCQVLKKEDRSIKALVVFVIFLVSCSNLSNSTAQIK